MSATIPMAPGGLTLAIDRIVVRGGGAIAPQALATAVERAFADAFVAGAVAPRRHRVIRAEASGATLDGVDGIAAAIRAAVAARLGTAS